MQGNCQCETQQLADGTIIGQTTTNGFAKTVVQTQPNTLGGFICTRSEYNAKGNVVKQPLTLTMLLRRLTPLYQKKPTALSPWQMICTASPPRAIMPPESRS